MENNSEKLDDMSERIRAAQAGMEAKKVVTKSPVPRNIGADFISMIVGSGILGALLDYAFGTLPWCLVGFIFLGFVAGIVSAWRSMQKEGS